MKARGLFEHRGCGHRFPELKEEKRGLSYVTSGTGCVLVWSSGKDSVSRSVGSPLFFYPPRKLNDLIIAACMMFAIFCSFWSYHIYKHILYLHIHNNNCLVVSTNISFWVHISEVCCLSSHVESSLFPHMRGWYMYSETDRISSDD
jgi:hypothetical protein